MISRSRRSLFKDQSFGGSDNAYIRQTSCMQGDAACKGGGGVGRWSAPGMVQCRGTRRRGTVVSVCLVPEGKVGVRKKNRTDFGGDKSTSHFLLICQSK